MGRVARHPGAPFVRGEILDGINDLEVDINNIVTEVNGNLDDTNIKAFAVIAGSKIADGSIQTEKLTDNSVTTAKLVDDAVTVAKMAETSLSSFAVDTYTPGSGVVATVLTSYVDVPGLSSVAITPGAIGDLVILDFQGTIFSTTRTYLVTFSINGVDQANLARFGSTGSTVHCSYAFAATSTAELTIKARYHSVSGATADVWTSGVMMTLLARAIPVK